MKFLGQCYHSVWGLTHLCAIEEEITAINRDQARGYKTFFFLNSTEHEIVTAHIKIKYWQVKMYLALSLSDYVFIMLINVKMPTIVGI